MTVRVRSFLSGHKWALPGGSCAMSTGVRAPERAEPAPGEEISHPKPTRTTGNSLTFHNSHIVNQQMSRQTGPPPAITHCHGTFKPSFRRPICLS